jgi:hypothetical protein
MSPPAAATLISPAVSPTLSVVMTVCAATGCTDKRKAGAQGCDDELAPAQGMGGYEAVKIGSSGHAFLLGGVKVSVYLVYHATI